MTQGTDMPKQHHRPTHQRHHYRTRSNNRPVSAGSSTTVSKGKSVSRNKNQHQKKRSSLSDLSRPRKRTQHRPSLDTCSSASSLNIVHSNGISSSSSRNITANFHSKHSKRNRITVAVRVRPLNSKEIKDRRIPVVRVGKENCGADPIVQISRLAKRGAYLKSEAAAHWEYGFDYAFNETTTQETVYEKTVKPLVNDLLGGINSTIFAYGATGAGKTHTMMGTSTDVGMIPRALKELFFEVGVLQEEFKSTGQNETIQIELSYLEVYNEKIYDLLNPGTKKSLEPREDPKKGIVIVAGLEQRVVRSEQDVMDAVQLGNHNRKMSATAANKVSSRSHAVLQVFVTRTKPAVPGKSRGRIIRGVMNLIDLAGSERASATNNRGMRLIEGANINKSLLALANCINALSNKCNGNLRNGGGKGGGFKRAKYRDSKLTHLLKSSLEGNCAMVMIAAINPSNHTFEESHNTLKYANRAKQIRITATAHEKAFSPAPKIKAKMLAEENAKLKMELMALRNANNESRLSIASNASSISSRNGTHSDSNISFQSDANSSMMDASIIEMIDDNGEEVEAIAIAGEKELLNDTCSTGQQKKLKENPKEAWIHESTQNVSCVVKPNPPSKSNVGTKATNEEDRNFVFNMTMTSLSNAPSMSEFEMPCQKPENRNSVTREAYVELEEKLQKLQNTVNTFAEKEKCYKNEITMLSKSNESTKKTLISKEEIIKQLKRELKSVKLENKVLQSKVNASMNESARQRRDELLALKADVELQKESKCNDNALGVISSNTSILQKGNLQLLKKRKQICEATMKKQEQENTMNNMEKEDVITNISMPPPKRRKRKNRRKSLIPVLKLNVDNAF